MEDYNCSCWSWTKIKRFISCHYFPLGTVCYCFQISFDRLFSNQQKAKNVPLWLKKIFIPSQRKVLRLTYHRISQAKAVRRILTICTCNVKFMFCLCCLNNQELLISSFSQSSTSSLPAYIADKILLAMVMGQEISSGMDIFKQDKLLLNNYI